MNTIDGSSNIRPVPVDVPSPLSREEAQQHRRLVQAVRSLNKSEFLFLGEGNQLQYAIDPTTRRPIVKVVNDKTKQVLYQIPPDEVLEMARELAKESGTE